MHPATRAAQFLRHSPGPRPLARLSRARARSVPAELTQTVGPTAPAHPAPGGLPWTNLETQETVQVVKAASKGLREPLLTDMGDDEIFVSKDSIHILKHHGSYMQQNRMLKGKEKQKSYQFMLRLKVPCGEIPPAVYKELDDLSNKYGQGDLRATTRQAFQLHGVLKGNLKTVIAAIANVGSNTYGGCGDINRNIMTPPVEFANNKAYGYANQYSRAIAELFKPMTEAFNEIWHAAPPPQPRTPRHSRSPGRRATAAAPLPPPPRQTPARPCLASERIPTARPQARRREGGDRRVLAARHWRVQA